MLFESGTRMDKNLVLSVVSKARNIIGISITERKYEYENIVIVNHKAFLKSVVILLTADFQLSLKKKNTVYVYPVDRCWVALYICLCVYIYMKKNMTESCICTPVQRLRLCH